jgi:hypothetical protein
MSSGLPGDESIAPLVFLHEGLGSIGLWRGSLPMSQRQRGVWRSSTRGSATWAVRSVAGEAAS